MPEEKIRTRYNKALRLLPKIIDVCDKIIIYDNSIKPTHVFKKDKEGISYFPTAIWPIDRLKKLLKR